VELLPIRREIFPLASVPDIGTLDLMTGGPEADVGSPIEANSAVPFNVPFVFVQERKVARPPSAYIHAVGFVTAEHPTSVIRKARVATNAAARFKAVSRPLGE
jgi:hypothetical protein